MVRASLLDLEQVIGIEHGRLVERPEAVAA